MSFLPFQSQHFGTTRLLENPKTPIMLWQLWVAIGFWHSVTRAPNPMVGPQWHFLVQTHWVFTLARELLTMTFDWRDLLKASLQELYDEAVGKRESLVPMIASLPLAREDDEVVQEVATMFSYFSGAVTWQVYYYYYSIIECRFSFL